MTFSQSPSPVSSSEPRTPVDGISPSLPSTATPTPATTSVGNKRKPSRRANTAERRATHNAVERQRRETLNSRFLDLAGLLPNLSQIRRPSKSSIVNSSIAHIHASRRHRILAARELRAMKVEADALRRELNEWRDRANLPRIEEPARDEGFSMILSGEMETLVVSGGNEEDEDGEDAGYPEGEVGMAYPDEPTENPRFAPSVHHQQAAHPFAHQVPAHRTPLNIPPATQMGGPMIASPTTVAFDNPAMSSMYPHQQQHVPGYPVPPPGSSGSNYGYLPQEKPWGMYPPHHHAMMHLHQRPVSSHAHSPVSTPPGSSSGLSAPDYMRGGRERSGSMSSGVSSHFSGGSPGRGSPLDGFEQQQWMIKQQQQHPGQHLPVQHDSQRFAF